MQFSVFARARKGFVRGRMGPNASVGIAARDAEGNPLASKTDLHHMFAMDSAGNLPGVFTARFYQLVMEYPFHVRHQHEQLRKTGEQEVIDARKEHERVKRELSDAQARVLDLMREEQTLAKKCKFNLILSDDTR